MAITDAQQRKAVKEFIQNWSGKGYEKDDNQKFWLSLLSGVFGIEHPERFIEFEVPVKLEHTSFIDGYIDKTKVLIEQKSLGKNLNAAIKQSDGTLLSPFQQAKRYITELPHSMHPRWLVTCNFEEFYVYDMEKPNGEPEIIKLKDLEKEYYRLSFLVDTGGNIHLKKEMEVSIKAGEIVGLLYEALLRQYINKDNEETLKSLNKLCVRLVFCLYAEDAGIFGRHNMFLDYLKTFETRHLRKALIDLFKVLDTEETKRDPYMDEDLKAFPYVNGGLFADEDIEIPNFTDEIRERLLTKASADFDWSGISPTIFGAVFESTLNPQTRRKGGMHYTSVENIHKVIDPLFMNDLNKEFEEILETKYEKTRRGKLNDFQQKIASLTFLDPACGSGNFLTETYISLRRLENKVLFELYGLQTFNAELYNPVKVSIKQFYGIEINDFAVTVAKTALWIAESQMLKETEDIIHQDLNFLPLKTYTNIVEGNALRLDWNEVVPKENLNYIMGNPPFVGARLMSANQKEDVINTFGTKWKNAGNLDYVGCWHKKAADMMEETNICTALVSTNSITQGEQVPILWKPLFAQGVHIDFAHRTFRWDSEASLKAHVHCVIVGFSHFPSCKKKELYTNDKLQLVDNINAYLIEAPTIFVESRNKPICEVPQIGIGNKPIDGGNYLFTKEEMLDFIKNEPKSEKYFRPWFGAEEFINQKSRYCLWLGDCPPNELRQMPNCLKRVENVRNLRLESKSEGTRKLAEKPTRFHVENMPNSTYIIIPSTSSERRKYIPIGFLEPNNLSSNAVHIIQNTTLYHFGILTSNVHMVWMRAVCGRLKSDYRYSKDIVYNNFPWPEICHPEHLTCHPELDSGSINANSNQTGQIPNQVRNDENEEFVNYCNAEDLGSTCFNEKNSPTVQIPDQHKATDSHEIFKMLNQVQHDKNFGSLCKVRNGDVTGNALVRNGNKALPASVRNDEFHSLEHQTCHPELVSESESVEMLKQVQHDENFCSFCKVQGDKDKTNDEFFRHKSKIEQTAQGILDARALYPDCSLADLYDELTMPPELRKAHQNNDKAVMEAYGFYSKDENGKTHWFTESEIVAELMKMYQELAYKN